MPHISKTAAKSPNKPAVIMASSGDVVTYKELDDASNRGAQLIRQLGLKTGDHACIMMENRKEYIEIYLAALRSGIFLTPVNAHLKLEEVSYILENSGARLLVFSQKYQAMARALSDSMTSVEYFYSLGQSVEGLGDWCAESASLPSTPIADEAKGMEMMYSSGTTGHPKGILNIVGELTLDELHPVVESMASSFGFNADSVYLSPGPLYHTAPLIWCGMVLNKQGTVVMMEKYDAELALRLIQDYKVTHSQWVPIMFIRMLKLPENVRLQYDTSSLKVAVHAAAPCPVEIKEQMIGWWGEVIYEYYAGSEGIGSTAIATKSWLAHKGSVGRPSYGNIHIVDDAGELLPAGEVGLIYFESDAKFEYHGEPEKTKGSYNDKGWATFGDIGFKDADGYLYLTDRKNFMIISGGANIYPQEVENCLILNESVADVAVFGVPDEEFGESVCAVVQLAEGVEKTPAMAEALVNWCREKISNVKSPKHLHFIDQLPRLENGKLYKRWLIEKYA